MPYQLFDSTNNLNWFYIQSENEKIIFNAKSYKYEEKDQSKAMTDTKIELPGIWIPFYKNEISENCIGFYNPI